MRKFFAATLLLLIVSSGLAFAMQRYGGLYPQEKPKNILKTTRLGPNDVAVVCLNGADPTGRKLDKYTLIISCGE